MKTPNLKAFYEDEHIFVCYKPPCFATQSSKIEICDMRVGIRRCLYDPGPEYGAKS